MFLTFNLVYSVQWRNLRSLQKFCIDFSKLNAKYSLNVGCYLTTTAKCKGKVKAYKYLSPFLKM